MKRDTYQVVIIIAERWGTIRKCYNLKVLCPEKTFGVVEHPTRVPELEYAESSDIAMQRREAQYVKMLR